MKHFIAFATLGIAAVGSGMALAAHFAMPGSSAPMAPTVSLPDAPDMPSARMPGLSLPSMSGVSMPDVSLPNSLPDSRAAIGDAGQAFGKATDTMAYYSDRAFGSTAQKVKRSVDDAKVPTIH